LGKILIYSAKQIFRNLFKKDNQIFNRNQQLPNNILPPSGNVNNRNFRNIFHFSADIKYININDILLDIERFYKEQTGEFKGYKFNINSFTFQEDEIVNIIELILGIAFQSKNKVRYIEVLRCIENSYFEVIYKILERLISI
jgi:hypothetical protein